MCDMHQSVTAAGPQQVSSPSSTTVLTEPVLAKKPALTATSAPRSFAWEEVVRRPCAGSVASACQAASGRAVTSQARSGGSVLS